jgi:hypothetical protein
MKLKLTICCFMLTVLASIEAADLASMPPRSSLSAGGSSFNPQWSSDGLHLVFVSHANNLVIVIHAVRRGYHAGRMSAERKSGWNNVAGKSLLLRRV